MGGVILGIEIAGGIALFCAATVYLVPSLRLAFRAWWYLWITTNAAPPPDVRRYLMLRGMRRLRGVNLPPDFQRSLAVEELAAVLDDKEGVFDEVLTDVVDDAMRRLASSATPGRGASGKREEMAPDDSWSEKVISTDRVLKHVYDLKNNYTGPDREAFVREIDQFVTEFRDRHGPTIPVGKAYAILKEIEGKYGTVR